MLCCDHMSRLVYPSLFNVVACSFPLLLISEHGSEGEIRTCMACLDQVNSFQGQNV